MLYRNGVSKPVELTQLKVAFESEIVFWDMCLISQPLIADRCQIQVVWLIAFDYSSYIHTLL